MEQPGLEYVVGEAVRCVRAEDARGASACLSVLGEDDVYVVTELLVEADAQMLTSLKHRLGTGPYLRIDISDLFDEPVEIDQVEPPLRCALRALLAAGCGDTDSSRLQLDLLFAHEDSRTCQFVLAHMLGWTADIVDTCEHRGADVPQWLNNCA